MQKTWSAAIILLPRLDGRKAAMTAAIAAGRYTKGNSCLFLCCHSCVVVTRCRPASARGMIRKQKPTIPQTLAWDRGSAMVHLFPTECQPPRSTTAATRAAVCSFRVARVSYHDRRQKPTAYPPAGSLCSGVLLSRERAHRSAPLCSL